ncbi:M15 family metallopeptidase [Blastochloris tepida]|uniref:D-alanyl-D-alanine carboxypeptidase-like core domain-containing protein n=1 Tax=Blastochloris tepida TaxID=2233851 RepID=A0A348FZV6_9HYPH|nr:M15 family metallopeptidase [Blastochloris tepida]BBF92839.1 hypothetical protein BLTE_15240 [Blastochloris tepida]
MPQVPEYQDTIRSPALEPGGTFRDNTTASPDAFGAGLGKGMQTLGKGMMDAAEAMARVQHLEDETVARSRRNAYMQARDALDYGENGYLTKDGQAAIDGFRDYQSGLEQLKRQHAEGLTPSQSELFVKSVQPMETEALRSAMQHRGKALKTFVIQEAQSGAENFKLEAIKNYGDPVKAQTMLAAGLSEIDGLGAKLGWPAERLRAEQQTFISDTHKQTAAQIANDDPVAALEYLTKNRTAMIPTDHAEALKTVLPIASHAVTSDAVATHKSARDFLTSRLTGGKDASHVAGLDGAFAASLSSMIQDAPPDIRDGLRISSGFRDAARQAGIVGENMGRYGFGEVDRAAWRADVAALGPEAAGAKWGDRLRSAGLTKMVALPGRSHHQSGQAVDLTWNGQRLDAAPQQVRDWVRDNADRFGLALPVAGEPWHIEPKGARGGTSVSGTATAYGPGGGGQEGGSVDMRERRVSTLEDYAAGLVPDITIAGNPKFEGRRYVIPEITFVGSDGQRRTLRDVPAVVRDTGSAFTDAPEGRFDIAVAHGMTPDALAKQPFSNTQLQFIPTGDGASGPALSPRVAVSPRIAKVLAELPENYGARLFDAATTGVAQAEAREAAQLKAQRLAAVDDYKLRIASEDAALTRDEILADPMIDNGDKAALLNEHARKFGEGQETRQAIAAFQAGQLVIDPYDTNGKQLADSVWQTLSAAVDKEQVPAVLGELVRQSGVVPQPVVNAIRGDLAGKSIAAVANAAEMAGRLMLIDPAALGRREGGHEVRDAAVTFAHLTTKVGLSREAAAQQIIDARDPEKRRERDALMKSDAVKKAIDDQATEDQVRDIFDRGLFRFDPKLGETPAQTAAMVAEYRDMLEHSVFDAAGNMDTAKALAADRFKRRYGVSEFTLTGPGTITRLPPEVTYPAGLDGTHGYVRQQLMDALKAAGVSADEAFLQSDTMTDQDVAAGRPARYRVFYRQFDGMFEQYHLPFFAVAPKKDEIAAARRAEHEQRRDRNMRWAEAASDRDIDAAKVPFLTTTPEPRGN